MSTGGLNSGPDRGRRWRAVTIALLCIVLPAIIVSFGLAQRHAQAPAWIAGTLGYLVLAGIVLYSSQVGRRGLLELSAAPSVIVVHRALDPGAHPIGVRLLTLDQGGLRLCSPSNTAKVAWTLNWSDIRSSELGDVTSKTGTSAGVVVYLKHGGTKRLRLPGRFGVGSDASAVQQVILSINQLATGGRD